MDDMAKIKVGPPTVRYHQLKRLFPSADQPYFSDHDFPIPGYYLNASGYMELDCSHFEPNTTVEFNELNSASVYDYEKNTINKIDRGHFTTVNQEPSTLLDCVFDQLRIHLNTKVNTNDLVDVLIEELRENSKS